MHRTEQIGRKGRSIGLGDRLNANDTHTKWERSRELMRIRITSMQAELTKRRWEVNVHQRMVEVKAKGQLLQR